MSPNPPVYLIRIIVTPPDRVNSCRPSPQFYFDETEPQDGGKVGYVEVFMSKLKDIATVSEEISLLDPISGKDVPLPAHSYHLICMPSTALLATAEACLVTLRECTCRRRVQSFPQTLERRLPCSCQC